MSDLDDLETFVTGCSFRTGFKNKKGVKPAGHRRNGIKKVLARGNHAARFHHKHKRPVTLAKIEIKPCPT